jgi:serine/threonine protein kinase
MSPSILDYGEWLGDIEINKPIMVLRSAVLYEATHLKKKVYVKVAHPGTENKERLKREAEFLRDNYKQNSYLPVLLSPYANTTIKHDAYGKTMLRGHLLYFYLFEHFEGDPLRDVLVKNPQLWINHVGWLLVSLASAVAFMHSKGIYHFGLTPEGVLVRFAAGSEAPRILLFDLGIVSDVQTIATNWYSFFVPPAYTAPELVDGRIKQPQYATDVYGLGLILYELLVGEPTFTFKLQRDDHVYQIVQRAQRVRMNRVEDVEAVAKVAVLAVESLLSRRQENATVLARQLMDYFGDVPD